MDEPEQSLESQEHVVAPETPDATAAPTADDATPKADGAAPTKLLGVFDSEDHLKSAFNLLLQENHHARARLAEHEKVLADPTVRSFIEGKSQRSDPVQRVQSPDDLLEMQAQQAIEEAFRSDDPVKRGQASQLIQALADHRADRMIRNEVPRHIANVVERQDLPRRIEAQILADPNASDLHPVAPVLAYMISQGMPAQQAAAAIRAGMAAGAKRVSAEKKAKDQYVEGADGTSIKSYGVMSLSEWAAHSKKNWQEIL